MEPTTRIIKVEVPPNLYEYYILFALEECSQNSKGYIRIFKLKDDKSWSGEEYSEDSFQFLNRLSSAVNKKEVWDEYVHKKDPNKLLSKHFPNDVKEPDCSKWNYTEHQSFTEGERKRIKEAVKIMQLPQPIVDAVIEMFS